MRAAQPDTEHKLENLILSLTDISICLWPVWSIVLHSNVSTSVFWSEADERLARLSNRLVLQRNISDMVYLSCPFWILYRICKCPKYILFSYMGVFSPTNLTVFLFYFILIVTTSSVEVNWIWGLKMFINQFSFSNFNNLVLSNN